MDQSPVDPGAIITRVDFLVQPDEGDIRFDQLVSIRFPFCSRSEANRLIRGGHFQLNHTVKKPAHRVAVGDRVTGAIPCDAGRAENNADTLLPEPVPLDILYQDDVCIVLNKAPGRVVHPAPGHTAGTLAHGLLHRFPDLAGVGASPQRPGIVHRLDKDTSGVLVVARTMPAYLDLVKQFKSRRVKKTYAAFVYGIPENTEGIIELPISRHPVHRKKMATTENGGGRRAETHWTFLWGAGAIGLMQFDIKTGRTHQIRVHAAAIGHPVVGDPTYTSKNPLRRLRVPAEQARLLKNVTRQQLHAHTLTFTHPRNRKEVTFTAPWPADMMALYADLQRAGHFG